MRLKYQPDAPVGCIMGIMSCNGALMASQMSLRSGSLLSLEVLLMVLRC